MFPSAPPLPVPVMFSASPTMSPPYPPPPAMSVLLCVCDDERFLPQALESLLAQTWTNFEIVAVDDASTDGSAGIRERYAQWDARLRVIRQPKRQGLAASLNQALFLAQGPVV